MKLQKRLIALLVGGSFVFTACKCERKGQYAVSDAAVVAEEVQQDQAVQTSKLDENGNFIYDIGKVTEISLPNGEKISAGENSSEFKLFNMMNDANFKVSDDKTQGWVTLDRVYFQTGKSELTESSKSQIENIVKLLKAFPAIQVKAGGYTDNTGAAETNMKISTDRSKTIADLLVAGGIDGSRISNEGYGANHFVCPANDTDECKAQNRRVDIRITKK